MRNEGFSLVEVLAALALTTLALTLVFSIWISGVKQGNGNKTDVLLQQEAQFVAQTLRNVHLSASAYTLKVEGDEILLDGKAISDRFTYEANISYQETTYGNTQLVHVNTRKPLGLILKFRSGDESYTLRTTLARGA